ELAARQRIDEAMATHRWSEAERELHALAASEAESPALAALSARISREQDAGESLRVAKELRRQGDYDQALAELKRIGETSAYAEEAAKERDLVNRGLEYQGQLERAVRDQRCSDALFAARRLAEIDDRPVPPSVTNCRPVEAWAAYRKGDFPHAY